MLKDLPFTRSSRDQKAFNGCMETYFCISALRPADYRYCSRFESLQAADDVSIDGEDEGLENTPRNASYHQIKFRLSHFHINAIV